MRKLREAPEIELTIHEEPPRSGGDGSVDSLLVSLARDLNARLLTNDENLAKVARLRSITVLSLNELALALQPQLAPGNVIGLELVKPGKDKHQAVGYLPDGTMIVVNHAAAKIGSSVFAPEKNVAKKSNSIVEKIIFSLNTNRNPSFIVFKFASLAFKCAGVGVRISAIAPINAINEIPLIQ